MDRDTIVQRIEQRADAVQEYGVDRLILTGSYAHGEAAEDSDIDFVVRFAPGRGGFRDYIGLLHLLEDLFDRDIDLMKEELVRDELRASILGGDTVEPAV